MKILADQNMPWVEAYFSDLGSIERFDGRQLTPKQVQDTDILLTRSVTQVNKELLDKATHLKFVGTATIGVDHIDQALLKSRDIAFAHAPGCNAVAVAEYVLSALFADAQQTGIPLQGKTLAIVGVGHIGRCLLEKLQGLGLRILLCDPIRHQQGSLPEHQDLDDVLAQADIVTFHVPLIKTGPYCTVHLLNKTRLALLKQNALIINACRGEVIDNQALLCHMQAGATCRLVLDVWENEPNILRALLPYVLYATTHIAGHTLEGKARGTQMLYQAVCHLFGKQPNKQLSDFLPQPALTQCQLNDTADLEDVMRLSQAVYDIRRDDGLLRAGLMSQGFDHLRKMYPIRREFQTLTIYNASPYAELLTQLGFNVVAQSETKKS